MSSSPAREGRRKLPVQLLLAGRGGGGATPLPAPEHEQQHSAAPEGQETSPREGDTSGEESSASSKTAIPAVTLPGSSSGARLVPGKSGGAKATTSKSGSLGKLAPVVPKQHPTGQTSGLVGGILEEAARGDVAPRGRLDWLDPMGPAGMGSVGLLEQCQQADVLAKYWADRAMGLRQRLREETAGAGSTSQGGPAQPRQGQAGGRKVDKQAAASPKPRGSQGPLPSPKRSRGRQDPHGQPSPLSPEGRQAESRHPSPLSTEGRQAKSEPASAACAAVASGADDDGGSGVEHGPAPSSTPNLGGRLAKLEPGLEPGPVAPSGQPSPVCDGRLESDGGQQEEVALELAEEQASSSSQEAVPGDVIKRFLGVKEDPIEGESGPTDSALTLAAVEPGAGESGGTDSAS